MPLVDVSYDTVINHSPVKHWPSECVSAIGLLRENAEIASFSHVILPCEKLAISGICVLSAMLHTLRYSNFRCPPGNCTGNYLAVFAESDS